MNESQIPQSLDPNNNQDKNNEAFKALIKTTETLSQGRSDGVAIVGIICVVIAFMTMIIIGGLVLYSHILHQA
jgi:hypothetical protein